MRGDSGQVAVEAALVIPIWLFVALGAVQLALMQQARLMTGYAAYSAARAGSVWSGNNERMRDAALLSIVPTFGNASSIEAWGNTYQRLRAFDRQVHDALAPSSDAPPALKQSGLLGVVRVDVVGPSRFETPELEFDSADTFGGNGHHGRAYDLFLRGDLDPAQDVARDQTLLTVRVRYLYELRIPFANQLLFVAWFASATGPGGSVSRAPHEGAFLSATATGAGPLGRGRRFFIPLTATWTQRMQSNFHRKWLTAGDAP